MPNDNDHGNGNDSQSANIIRHALMGNSDNQQSMTEIYRSFRERVNSRRSYGNESQRETRPAFTDLTQNTNNKSR